MAEVADLTQKEIDELLEGNDSNGVENVQIDLDDDLILDEEPIEETTKTTTRDSEASDKLLIDEESNSVQSPISDSLLAGPSYVDSTSDSALNNNFPRGTKNSNEVVKEEITTLDSDDEGGIPVVSMPRRRRKEPIYVKERNMARQIISGAMACSDGTPNSPAVICIRNTLAKICTDHAEYVKKLEADIQEMIKMNTIGLGQIREEKRGRLLLSKEMSKMQEELESLKKSILIQKPIPQPIYGPTDQFQQQQQRTPQQQQQQRTPQQQHQQRTQQHQQPQLQQPVRQYILQPYTPQLANAQIPMCSQTHPTPINNSSSMRKRSSDHFTMMSEPRKTIRMEFSVMANPNEPSNQQPTQHHIELTERSKPGRAYGHNIEYHRENPNPPFRLEAEQRMRELMCIVPRVPTDKLSLNELYEPKKPSFFDQYDSSDVAVNIKSTKDDFFENWQIAGTVEYPNCSKYAESKIELFIQIQSMKPFGLYGVIRQTNQTIDWACSHLQDCSSTGKTKFRIKFHRNQQIPVNDQISIFASLDDGSRIYVSKISTLIYC